MTAIGDEAVLEGYWAGNRLRTPGLFAVRLEGDPALALRGEAAELRRGILGAADR